ncbi:receptor-like protein EIX2 [Syzygium oleosum]|uniref:receptor-like protein EIX2 n=1 Tax=Syzygium oleosum TaxID=219896 RepID=UPI0024B8CC3C|nr:receptor-like protein EIX2 [Syzygium oleosum]
MASYFYTSFMPTLLCALFVIQALEFSHSKALTNVSCIVAEREALLQFKQDLIDPLRRLWSWTGKGCCEWEGVKCSKKTGHISKLDLRNPCDGLEECSLGGKIHPALKELKNLKYLDLSFNNFSNQKIPEFLASLQKLEYLNLSHVGFYGDISHQLCNLSSLRYLDLNSEWTWSWLSLETKNLIWLSTFSNLKYLDLSYVHVLNPKEWFSPINLLSSLEFLILRECDLGDISTSLHVNFTSLRFLDLSFNSMNSSIPPWYQNFSKLKHLDLSSNDLQGIFPIVILKNSRWLRFLDVSANRLEGELLKNLSIFCDLQVLSLSYNQFSGRISDTRDGPLICRQTNLKTIDVSNNNFSGQLPNQFVNFKDLELLDLSRSSISGSIPATVGQLSSLRKLALFSNNLSGNIPESIGQLSNLEIMDIGDNQLDGVVSELHLANLTSLTELYFWSNELVINVNASWVPPFQIQAISMSNCKVGPKFPNWLQTQKNISMLYMSNASISDEVPHWLPDILSNIEELDLSHNMLRGNISRIIGKNMSPLRQVLLSRNNLSGVIPNSLCMLDGLYFVDLSKNQLSGRLPQCWRKSQANLEWILLGDNMLNGQIPNSLCHLKQLRALSLHENVLNGVLPKCLLKLDLANLDLSDNQFTGRVPPFGRHSRLFTIINLERNYFTGAIPLQLCHLTNLQYLSLAHNNLFGSIPHCFKHFSQMWANSTFSPSGGFMARFPIMVNIKGTSQEFTTTLPYLFSIDLSCNSLDGQIPEGLTWLAQLRNLNLSQNKLIGKIPSDIGNLRDLESLDLSNNKLSGEIPPSIANLDFLSHLDLSFNNLSGLVPSGNHLGTLDDQSAYQGNDGLCGAPHLKICVEDEHNDMDKQDGHRSSEDESNESYSIVVWFYLGVGAGFVVAFLGFCGILYFKKPWRITYFRAVDRVIEKIADREDNYHTLI